ncbi:transcriptional regulation of mitochondrial recombination-domain-containing protein [Diplogelasinospora grovesii]|uniref:Large ribosomal subunit protein mL67 n=1 Tax=Diplogelasinospora grovesii TaxID=303347 RepID=A0AAN6N7E7_9PEZI|nr:transcriptional regulation of mitochondrial recombination-domain-containing protein [Diplogelasinospora grovesii]
MGGIRRGGGGGGGVGIRHLSKKAKATAAKYAERNGTAPPKKPAKPMREPSFPEGHGEKLWVFNHIEADHVLYSHEPYIRSHKAKQQMPYTGKKLVPSKLRKDYWRPLAMISFGEGLGPVGRNVFQKLREFKKRHELEWATTAQDDDRTQKMYNMSREERGKALNDQRGNSVADLAAVLSGVGKGNKMWIHPTQKLLKEEEAEGKEEQKADEEILAEVGGERQLREVTVYWANAQDRFYAREWSDNVTHVVGLPPMTEKERVKMEALMGINKAVEVKEEVSTEQPQPTVAA